MKKSPKYIEIIPDEGASNGGYIDFHYGGSTEDFTTRIIEKEAGWLAVDADRFEVGGRINAQAYYGSIATSGSNTDYTAVVNGLNTLLNGLKITIIPHVDATESTTVTLNVNNLGAKTIRHNAKIYANVPLTLTYSTAYGQWFADDSPTAKPTGTYTGNGSSAGRDIITGGIGNAIIIYANNFCCSGYLTPQGGFMAKENITSVNVSGVQVFAAGGSGQEIASYSNGTIHLATSHNYLNQNGVVYKYMCI